MLLKAWYLQYRGPCFIFITLFSIALSLGVALLSQERAIKQSSANVSDKFDLIIGAPGSKIDLTLDIAFLQTGFLETVPTHIWYQLLDDKRVEWFAPIVLGDSYHGRLIVGTTATLLDSLYSATVKFPDMHAAFVGANIALNTGDNFKPQHGLLESAEHTHHVDYHVVGKLPKTGTPWDDAILVPVETSWDIHGLGDGHHHEQEHDDEDEQASQLGVFNIHSPLKPVSAFVVKPASIASAYGLRSDFSNNETQAVFPAEVMVILYSLMGDARVLMSYITLICEALVLLSLLFSIASLFALFKREFAILRTIGATRNYLLLSVWLFVFSLMAIGVLVGMLLATLEVQWISHLLSNKVQFNVEATLNAQDWYFAFTVLFIGSILALLPALFVYQVSNEKLMQSI